MQSGLPLLPGNTAISRESPVDEVGTPSKEPEVSSTKSQPGVDPSTTNQPSSPPEKTKRQRAIEGMLADAASGGKGLVDPGAHASVSSSKSRDKPSRSRDKSYPKLKVPDSQDDWRPAVIWLIDATKDEDSEVVEFSILLQAAKEALRRFGWDLSTTSDGVIENSIRGALIQLERDKRISLGRGGQVALFDLEDDNPPVGDAANNQKAVLWQTLTGPDEEGSEVDTNERDGDFREPLSPWGKDADKLRQAIRWMKEIILELLEDHEDFQNVLDIANAFFEDGSKSWRYDARLDFNKFKALVAYALKELISEKSVSRDRAKFLVISR